MKTIRQFLDHSHRSLYSVRPSATVREALEIMAQHNIGALLVLEGSALAGIFSERDYARKVILFGKTSRETQVREVMTHSVVCVRPTQTVEECMALMTEGRLRHLPVIERVTPEIEAMAGGPASDLSRGGMRTKVEAAKIAASFRSTRSPIAPMPTSRANSKMRGRECPLRRRDGGGVTKSQRPRAMRPRSRGGRCRAPRRARA